MIDINTVITIAKEAGRILLAHKDNFEEQSKGEGYDVGTIVTSGDLASEKFITEQINTHFPGHGVFGEEGTRENIKNEYVWYIDPLDGTAAYARDFPFWGVSMGLTLNGEPVLGVLHFPMSDLTVYAEKGAGAFANSKKIKASDRSLKKSLYYAGGLWQGKMYDHKGLLSNVGMVQILSASAYELAQIAMGNAEIYLLMNNPIDVIAGVCIVREAGGIVTESDGSPWSLGSKTILVATESTHSEIVSIISKDPYGV